MEISGIHHVALIVSDIENAKRFYRDVLGLTIIAENYREERDSWKIDWQLPDGRNLEMFSFPGSPERPSYPEARGLSTWLSKRRILIRLLFTLTGVVYPSNQSALILIPKRDSLFSVILTACRLSYTKFVDAQRTILPATLTVSGMTETCDPLKYKSPPTRKSGGKLVT